MMKLVLKSLCQWCEKSNTATIPTSEMVPHTHTHTSFMISIGWKCSVTKNFTSSSVTSDQSKRSVESLFQMRKGITKNAPKNIMSSCPKLMTSNWDYF